MFVIELLWPPPNVGVRRFTTGKRFQGTKIYHPRGMGVKGITLACESSCLLDPLFINEAIRRDRVGRDVVMIVRMATSRLAARIVVAENKRQIHEMVRTGRPLGESGLTQL
jgi:hypothetical protein